MPDDTVNEELLAGYLTFMRRRALTDSTIANRARNLRSFLRWVDRPLASVTRDDIEGYLDSRHIVAKTRARRVSDLACWWRWMVDEELVADDPTRRVARPRVPKGLPRPMGDEDLAAAVDEATPKLAVILRLAALGGLRAIEIARLTREDVLDTYDPPMIVVHGKGNKPRVVPLHPEILAALRRLPMPRAGHVLTHADGTSYTNEAIATMANRYLHSVGVPASLHQCRHWFGTRTYQATRDLRSVQELMGHASPESTAGYAAWDVSDSVGAVRDLRLPGRDTAPTEAGAVNDRGRSGERPG